MVSQLYMIAKVRCWALFWWQSLGQQKVTSNREHFIAYFTLVRWTTINSSRYGISVSSHDQRLGKYLFCSVVHICTIAVALIRTACTWMQRPRNRVRIQFMVLAACFSQLSVLPVFCTVFCLWICRLMVGHLGSGSGTHIYQEIIKVFLYRNQDYGAKTQRNKNLENGNVRKRSFKLINYNGVTRSPVPHLMLA